MLTFLLNLSHLCSFSLTTAILSCNLWLSLQFSDSQLLPEEQGDSYRSERTVPRVGVHFCLLISEGLASSSLNCESLDSLSGAISWDLSSLSIGNRATSWGLQNFCAFNICSLTYKLDLTNRKCSQSPTVAH